MSCHLLVLSLLPSGELFPPAVLTCVLSALSSERLIFIKFQIKTCSWYKKMVAMLNRKFIEILDMPILAHHLLVD